MKILAFDPGTTTGIALVEVEKTSHKLLYALNLKWPSLDMHWFVKPDVDVPPKPDIAIIETPKRAWGRRGRVNISNLATGMVRGGYMAGFFASQWLLYAGVVKEIDPSEWLVRFAHGDTARAARNDEIWAAFKNLFPEPYENVKAYHDQMGKGEHSRDAALMAYAIGHEELLKEIS